MTNVRTAHIEYDKVHEHYRRFDTLPNVLIQDPARHCAYYIPAPELARFEVEIETWAKVDDSTVTFIIPHGDIIDEVPPSLRTPELKPSVLIKFSRGKKSYFLTYEELQQFKVPQPEEAFDPRLISFIIPRGTELIEELPLMRRALLQSNTQ